MTMKRKKIIVVIMMLQKILRGLDLVGTAISQSGGKTDRAFAAAAGGTFEAVTEMVSVGASVVDVEEMVEAEEVVEEETSGVVEEAAVDLVVTETKVDEVSEEGGEVVVSGAEEVVIEIDLDPEAAAAEVVAFEVEVVLAVVVEVILKIEIVDILAQEVEPVKKLHSMIEEISRV